MIFYKNKKVILPKEEKEIFPLFTKFTPKIRK